MNKEGSMNISAAIGNIIASEAPVVRFSEDEVALAMREYTAGELEEMKELGLLPDGFRTFFVIRRFCEEYGIDAIADAEYMLELYGQAKCLDTSAHKNDLYMKAVKFAPVRQGDVFLTYAEYGRGEIFQYDMPDMSRRLVVPKLGFYGDTVRFPALYEGNVPWVSVCPSEVNSMAPDIAAAHGRCLVLGLGLGYYAFMAAQSPAVQSVTVVENNPAVIDIFEKHLLPCFPCRDKIKVTKDDAVLYVASLRDGMYDFCFADIWEGVTDGAPLYESIRASASRLVHTEFRYWIEEQLLAYLGKSSV